MRFVGIVVLFAIAVLAASRTAQGERYTAYRNGKQVVVHTRALPVVAHRVVPPFYGRHVYERPGGRRARRLRGR